MRTILIIAALLLPTAALAKDASSDNPYARLETRAEEEGWSPERLERARKAIDRNLDREIRLKKLGYNASDTPYKRLEVRAAQEGWTPEELERARQAVDRHLDREIRVKKLSD